MLLVQRFISIRQSATENFHALQNLLPVARELWWISQRLLLNGRSYLTNKLLWETKNQNAVITLFGSTPERRSSECVLIISRIRGFTNKVSLIASVTDISFKPCGTREQSRCFILPRLSMSIPLPFVNATSVERGNAHVFCPWVLRESVYILKRSVLLTCKETPTEPTWSLSWS